MMCYRDRTYCPFLECEETDCDRKKTQQIVDAASRAGLLICQFVDKPDCFKGAVNDISCNR
jgi:hypothetical protein